MFLLETTFLCKIFVHREERYKIGRRREMSEAVLVNFLRLDKIGYIWETGSFMICSVTKNPSTYLCGFKIIFSEIPPWKSSLCIIFSLVHNFCFLLKGM